MKVFCLVLVLSFATGQVSGVSAANEVQNKVICLFTYFNYYYNFFPRLKNIKVFYFQRVCFLFVLNVFISFVLHNNFFLCRTVRVGLAGQLQLTSTLSQDRGQTQVQSYRHQPFDGTEYMHRYQCEVACTDKSYSEPVLCTYLTPSPTNRALYLGRALQIRLRIILSFIQSYKTRT